MKTRKESLLPIQLTCSSTHSLRLQKLNMKMLAEKYGKIVHTVPIMKAISLRRGRVNDLKNMEHCQMYRCALWLIRQQYKDPNALVLGKNKRRSKTTMILSSTLREKKRLLAIHFCWKAKQLKMKMPALSGGWNQVDPESFQGQILMMPSMKIAKKPLLFQRIEDQRLENSRAGLWTSGEWISEKYGHCRQPLGATLRSPRCLSSISRM
jgi:hypothetical protein